ncbi:MAG TPA: rubredoxin [Parafilimonas sp.]|nr:rubredoxin [Parafilimonas sp.]
MTKFQTYILPFKAGIISPGYLDNILQVAAAGRIEHVSFSLRQEMVIHVPLSKIQDFEHGCREQNIIAHPLKKIVPNIVSSYIATGLSMQETWLREGIYKDVFELFDYDPQLKINVCDHLQSFVPLFTGHLNWIASEQVHYWYLYIRLPHHKELYRWPELIYTNNIAVISKEVEKLIAHLQNKNEPIAKSLLEDIFKFVKNSTTYIHKETTKPLTLPAFQLTYYEGFTRGVNDYWLGIYRRDELFPVAFLRDICAICKNTTISQLYATPWKSIIIKNIQPQHRYFWDHVLGKYRINVRHAANELNWQVEDNTDDGLLIKRHIVRHFDKEDVRTYGLCFAVQTKPSSYMFGSVILRKSVTKNPGRLKSLERFDILYTRDFNPNSSELVLYRERVEKDHIGTYLVSLCKLFYEQQSKVRHSTQTAYSTANTVTPAEKKFVYQCNDCLSVYDEAPGDMGNNISAGTSFDSLPEDYCCALCDAPKNNFTAVDAASLMVLLE